MDALRGLLPASMRGRGLVLLLMIAGAVFLLGSAVLTRESWGGVFDPPPLTAAQPAACKPRWDAGAAAVPAADAASSSGGKKLKITIVSVSNGQRPAGLPAVQRRRAVLAEDAAAKRSQRFGNTIAQTHANKEAYAARHGYTYVDFTGGPPLRADLPGSVGGGTGVLNGYHKPSWSKIRAVTAALIGLTDGNGDKPDWVMWLDADTLFTNPNIALETVLPPAGSGVDLVITKDPGGFNAGIWFLRNSQWSRTFLAQWWAMTGAYERKDPKDSKSGDNDALKALLADMPAPEFSEHVGVVPQCAFNSYLWRNSLTQWLRFLTHPGAARASLHRPDHLLLHMAGHEAKDALVNATLTAMAAAEARRQQTHTQHAR